MAYVYKVETLEQLAQVEADRKEYYEREYQSYLQGARANFDAYQRLKAAGLSVELTRYDLGWWTITVSKAQLPTVRAALGHKLALSHKDIADSKKNLVSVYLICEPYPALRIQFTQKLSKEAKCRIVRKRVTSRTLVCDV